jgi:hypothetical protein
VLTERQVAAVVQTRSQKKITAPTFDSERAKLDRLLEEAPHREYDDEQRALIAALGLGDR